MSVQSFDCPNLGDSFDLARCVSSGQVFRWAQLPDHRWLGVDGDHWFLVSEEKVCSNAPPEAFESLFRLDTDFDALSRELLARGPELEPYLDVMRGLRLLRPSDPVETFFSFLCTPNNHILRIAGMVRYLASLGEPLGEVEEVVLHRFPGVDLIAATPEAELRARGFGYRGATIPAIAKDLQSRGGRAYLEGLRNAPYMEVHDELLTFKGIGRKLADCIALFALHHTDAVPIDTHIWQAATRIYFPEWQGTNLTDKKYLAVGDHMRNRFGDLAGWAQQFLFYENVVNWRSRKSSG